MKKLIIITLAIVALSTPGYACGDWVLEHSDITGGRSGKAVNYCYYQALDGSGKTLSVQLPTYKSCPIILDPCPEAGSNTEITITQTPKSERSEAEMRRQWQEEYQEFLRLNPDRR